MLEKPPKNTIHEQTSNTPSTSSNKLEVVQGKNLNQITSVLTKLIETIQDGEGIAREDIAKLKEALGNIEVNLGPYPFPLTRLITLSKEELEEQVNILHEIYQDDFGYLAHLKIITPLVSKQLEKVRGDLCLSHLTSAEGLTLPQAVDGDLDLSSLTSAAGLTLPQTINGGLSLVSLTSAAGLTLPQAINGGLYLSSLTSALSLTLPQAVGGNIYLFSLTPEEIQRLKEDRPDLAGKIIK